MVINKPRMATIKRDEHGFTLAGVIAIIAVGVGGLFFGATMLQASAKKEEDKAFIHSLNIVNQNSDKAYFDKYSHGKTGDDLTSRFMSLNAFEAPISVIGGKPYTPYENRSPISVNVLSKGGNFLIVSFDGIDRETCLNLIELNSESSYDSVGIGGVNPYGREGTTENNPSYEIADNTCTENNSMHYLIKSR